jgi:HSP20 family protein|uniref:Hsp20/alpha crystallin family protein n=1 Tax=Desulfobacca acetoxidans TaxID=60893 RepID=A0A7V6DPP0_9BACT
MPIFFESDLFQELDRLQRQMDALFQNVAGRERAPRVGVYPLVNISEDQDHIYVRAELPGVNPEDLDITIKDQHLVIRGERKIPTEEKDVNYHRRERESGFFRRVVRLPVQVDPNKVEAACKDGVLTVTLAKPEQVKPRQITVKGA